MEPSLRQDSQNWVCYVIYRVNGSIQNKPNVSLTILVIITSQGDIFELGLDGFCLLFIA